MYMQEKLYKTSFLKKQKKVKYSKGENGNKNFRKLLVSLKP